MKKTKPSFWPKFQSWCRTSWPILAILVLALVLRLPLLNGSFWLDEAAQALESARPLSQQTNIIDDFQPPFLHFLLHFVMQMGVYSESGLRFFGALIPGILTIWGTYLLAKKLFNKPTALFASFLLATSSFHIYLCQELRPYSWSAVWGIWSWIFLLESENCGSQSFIFSRNSFLDRILRQLPFGRDFVFFIISTILGLYTSYLYPFVLMAQIFYLLTKGKFTKLFLTGGLSLAGFLPWLPIFWKQFQAGSTLRTVFPGWEQIVSFDHFRSVFLTVAKFIFGWCDLQLDLYYIVLSIIFIILFLILLFQKLPFLIKKPSPKPIFALLIALIMPFLFAWLVSFLVPIIQPKRVIFLLPLFYILISSLIFGSISFSGRFTLRRCLQPFSRQFCAVLFAIILIFINFMGIYHYWTQPQSQRENWRDLYHQIRTTLPTDRTLAVFAYPGPFSPWTWYDNQSLSQSLYDLPLSTFSTGSYDTSTASLDWQNEFRAVIPNYQTILTFDYLKELTDQPQYIDQILTEFGYVQNGVFDYPQIGFVRIWQSDTDKITSPNLNFNSDLNLDLD